MSIVRISYCDTYLNSVAILLALLKDDIRSTIILMPALAGSLSSPTNRVTMLWYWCSLRTHDCWVDIEQWALVSPFNRWKHSKHCSFYRHINTSITEVSGLNESIIKFVFVIFPLLSLIVIWKLMRYAIQKQRELFDIGTIGSPISCHYILPASKWLFFVNIDTILLQ